MTSAFEGGRLKTTRRDVVKFISSIEADERIAASTILVNQAHVITLARAGVIQKSAAQKLLGALRRIKPDNFSSHNIEDVHMYIEQNVTARTGRKVGGLLHIGKSRNDQVATAVRMSLRNELLGLSESLLAFEKALLDLAKRHTSTVFPGYTHLQPAQPISFAHYLIANAESLLRDSDRILETFGRVNKSPMGAGALAGTSFPLDRKLTARLLGFDGLVETSLDAVGSRDFVLEALSVFALISSDLSRMANDFIYYSSSGVGLVAIPDEFASTSSIMPQKKNPDPLELIRAKCGKVATNFNSAITIMHGLPSGYNLDYQELTPLLWKSIDELKACTQILTEMIPLLQVSREIKDGNQFTAATEVANILVREESVPFRSAHRIVGALVRDAIRTGKSLGGLTQTDLERQLGRPVRSSTLALIAKSMDLKQLLLSYRTSGSPNPQESRRLIRLSLQKWGDLRRDTLRRQHSIADAVRALQR